ncbi:ribonuclease E inhibitor RraB [Bowmanella yangjiangensis]|uniref:Ribonuclease E inhibitor RraB n=1 Tax=Bowmanella yangjiangensis TaxID=2811230 RepID=A0ABS3CZP6_9ALTE|nr:ribonuclease E inhibitor RraB [Bowmanella yangjiangensis]MBN7822573.1 ribonuclease E inhibitor RraB [Bowmanella yangjiangensis]
MSKIVAALLDNAYQDTQLLISNDQQGDIFSEFREVDFTLYSKNKEKGELIASFINDNNYGKASYEKIEQSHRITVVINMPTTQNLICSVSGLMVCLAALYDLEYDGWGCALKTKI